MAERRMFAKTIVDSDSFLDMPLSAQALYFHLGMRADDDGFLNNPKKIQRIVNASDDDLKILFAKNFVIPFNSGVVVIKHWKINNQIKADRYKPTLYVEEKSLLTVKDNNSYSLDMEKEQNVSRMVPECIQNGSKVEPQYSIGKYSIGKDSIGKDSLGEVREGKDKVVDYQLIADMYNETCVSFPKLTVLSDARKKTIKARLKTYTIEDFQKLFEKAEQSTFLKGSNNRSWSATFDWLIKDSNMAKVLDGNYDDKKSSGMTKPTNRVARELEESYDMMREWLEESKAKEGGENGDGT